MVDVNRNVRNLRPDQIERVVNTPAGCLVVLASPIMEHGDLLVQFNVKRREGRSLRDRLKAALIAKAEPIVPEPAASGPWKDVAGKAEEPAFVPAPGAKVEIGDVDLGVFRDFDFPGDKG